MFFIERIVKCISILFWTLCPLYIWLLVGNVQYNIGFTNYFFPPAFRKSWNINVGLTFRKHLCFQNTDVDSAAECVTILIAIKRGSEWIIRRKADCKRYNALETGGELTSKSKRIRRILIIGLPILFRVSRKLPSNAYIHTYIHTPDYFVNPCFQGNKTEKESPTYTCT